MLVVIPTEALYEAFESAQEAHPEMSDAIRLRMALIEAGGRLGIEPLQAAIDSDTIHQRLQAGQALLQGQEGVADAGELLEFGKQVCGIITSHHPQLQPALQQIEADLPELLESKTADQSQAKAPAEDGGSEVDDQLAHFVVRQSRYPFLRAHVLGLAPLITDVPQTMAACPICGGEPAMAALKEPDGERHLLCRECDTEWRYRRLGCPFCGNQDFSSLAYHLGDSPAYRLYICEQCRRYLKTIDERQKTDHQILPVEHVLSIGMDAAAIEAGYLS